MQFLEDHHPVVLQTKLVKLPTCPLPMAHVHTFVAFAYVSHTASACPTAASSGLVAEPAIAAVADTGCMHLLQVSPEAGQKINQFKVMHHASRLAYIP